MIQRRHKGSTNKLYVCADIYANTKLMYEVCAQSIMDPPSPAGTLSTLLFTPAAAAACHQTSDSEAKEQDCPRAGNSGATARAVSSQVQVHKKNMDADLLTTIKIELCVG